MKHGRNTDEQTTKYTKHTKGKRQSFRSAVQPLDAPSPQRPFVCFVSFVVQACLSGHCPAHCPRAKCIACPCGPPICSPLIEEEQEAAEEAERKSLRVPALHAPRPSSLACPSRSQTRQLPPAHPCSVRVSSVAFHSTTAATPSCVAQRGQVSLPNRLVGCKDMQCAAPPYSCSAKRCS